ncbi:hypothetical protein AALO_G00210090 [Alosa alosa]|uniref:Cadherin Y-type LIR-motif domain-containing protein n=2 Tax=Alosa alosa TaxID=278164 RepID=A0AAV6G422_9TELE|nr:hypothetical protein AALO_G00210090 [Alosa alosa]
MVVLYVGVRRQKEKETLMTSKEDVRDNVIHYDDEGGGEEDTHAFDMGTLRNPVKAVDGNNQLRRDIRPEPGLAPPPPHVVVAAAAATTSAPTSATTSATTVIPPGPLSSHDAADIRGFLQQRLQQHDADVSAPPYDSLATYAYEGEGSVAESLSSIQSLANAAGGSGGGGAGEADDDYDYLSEWGPRFRTLAGIFGDRSESQSDLTSSATSASASASAPVTALRDREQTPTLMSAERRSTGGQRWRRAKQKQSDKHQPTP